MYSCENENNDTLSKEERAVQFLIEKRAAINAECIINAMSYKNAKIVALLLMIKGENDEQTNKLRNEVLKKIEECCSECIRQHKEDIKSEEEDIEIDYDYNKYIIDMSGIMANLLKNGADINEVIDDNINLYLIEELVSSGVDLGTLNSNKKKALLKRCIDKEFFVLVNYLIENSKDIDKETLTSLKEKLSNAKRDSFFDSEEEEDLD